MPRTPTLNLDSEPFDPQTEKLLAEAIAELRERGNVDRQYVESFVETLLEGIEIRCLRHWKIPIEHTWYDRATFTAALCDALGVV